MSERVLVTDAEGETKHIGVRQNRAEHRQKPETCGHATGKAPPSRAATNPCVTIVGIGRSTRLVLVSADFSHAESWRRLQGQPKHLRRYEKAGRYVGRQHVYFLRENMGRFRRRERENGCAKSHWSVDRVRNVDPSRLT